MKVSKLVQYINLSNLSMKSSKMSEQKNWKFDSTYICSWYC